MQATAVAQRFTLRLRSMVGRKAYALGATGTYAYLWRKHPSTRASNAVCAGVWPVFAFALALDAVHAADEWLAPKSSS